VAKITRDTKESKKKDRKLTEEPVSNLQKIKGFNVEKKVRSFSKYAQKLRNLFYIYKKKRPLRKYKFYKI
jgi:hypothetical protein